MNNIKETDSHEEKGDVPGEKHCVTTLIITAKSYYVNTQLVLSSSKTNPFVGSPKHTAPLLKG